MSIDLTTYEPKKILVCQLKQIGDVIISTAMVELLARRYPKAEIHFLVEARSASMLDNNPHLAKVWTVKNGGPLHDLKTFLSIRHEQYDLLVDFQQLPRTRRATMFSGARVKLSYETKWYKRICYTHFAPMKKGGYAGKFKAQILSPLGIRWDAQPPRLYLNSEEKTWAKTTLREAGLQDNDPLMVIDATHWSRTRRWFSASYAETVHLLATSRPDLKFYLLHGPGEREIVEKILSLTGSPERCILPEYEPSLRKTAAIIGHADMFLGNCSAPRHMAVALGTPSLTIVGSNGNTAWNFPSPKHGNVDARVSCRKCNQNTCPNGSLRCLKEISPETVANRTLEAMDSQIIST